jgi:hypothetical protein
MTYDIAFTMVRKKRGKGLAGVKAYARGALRVDG